MSPKVKLLSTVLAAAAGCILTAQTTADATVLSCPSRDGTVRVWDQATNRCGSLTYNNADWRTIGSPSWNDRMDDFGNDDWTRGRSMCLYRDINYKGTSVRLRPGYRAQWSNTVSSNRWTTASTCP